ncbi:MAG: VWA domain-containing protein [Elusimicrobia bacterium]|nr:VWA domain-containing protein [Elusimicrobiota bacterium]
MFRNPLYLMWLAVAAGAAAALHLWAARRRRELARSLGDPETIARLLPPEAGPRRRLKAALLLCGLALAFAALAGPQWGVELVATRSDMRQVFVAVDTSLSMTAEDASPNRLEKAKRELSGLLDALQGERVGVIAFAGDAGILCPLTSDVAAAKQILAGVSADAIPVPGTAVGTAVRLAAGTLQRYPGGKAVVLLTDGEDHRSDPAGAAAEAAASGVRIFAIGIGTPQGNPLPVKEAGSGALTGYKKDRKGATVISRLGEKTLAEMAAQTGGAYYRASPAEDEVADIARRIKGLERSQGETGASQQYRNRFLYPLAAAFLLLLAEPLVPLRRARAAAKGPPSPEGGRPPLPQGAALLLLCLLPLPGRAAVRESELRAGNSLYQKRRFEDALERYRAAQRPGDARPDFNAGDALYRLEDFEESARRFQGLAEDPKTPRELRAAAYYNLGGALVRKGDYAGAVSAYRRAVVLGPEDRDARENLAVALRLLKNPPPPRKKCDKPDDKKKEGKGGGGGDKKDSQPPTPAPRPQDGMSKEDAARIMRAVAEKEKAAKQSVQQFSPQQQKRPPSEEDW